MFASGIGWLLKQLSLFLVSIWLGTFIGGASLLAGELADGGPFDTDYLVYSPVFLLSLWLIPNVCFLAAAIYWFVREETETTLAYGILIGVESLVAVAGGIKRLDGWLPLSTTWATCLVLIGMAGAGLWFFRQWQINRWAGELEILKAENAARRAEMKEQFGTDSAGVDEIGME